MMIWYAQTALHNAKCIHINFIYGSSANSVFRLDGLVFVARHSNHFCTIFISSFTISFFPFVRAAHEHHILHNQIVAHTWVFPFVLLTQQNIFFLVFRVSLSLTVFIHDINPMWWLSNAFWILFELFVGFFLFCISISVFHGFGCGLSVDAAEKKLGYLITGIHIR